MLLDDDIVTDGQTKPRALAGGLRRKERIKHLFLHLRRNARAVVADPDFDAVAEVLGRAGVLLSPDANAAACFSRSHRHERVPDATVLKSR
jgi:hypothetical protein